MKSCNYIVYTVTTIVLLPIFCIAQNSTDEDSKLIESMSIEQKVGQLFLLGFMGTKSEQNLDAIIRDLKPGGIILFSRNIEGVKQTSQLIYNAQRGSYRYSKAPLLIAVDQEGGDVIRIRTYPPLPSARALGSTGEESLVFDAGVQTAKLLKSLGINMNLAPVLDIADPKFDNFIGNRSFGDNPQTVSQMGNKFAAGLHAGGVLATAKHFPGHGGIHEDSHLQTPTKNISLDTLLNYDVFPFKELAQQGETSAIMVAHIAYPQIDHTLTPATYSKTMIQDILRKQLGFKGLVVTDDLEMAGAGDTDPSKRAIQAINAGVDLVMLAWNKKLQHQVIKKVIQAAKNGEIEPHRINESVARILKIKREYIQFGYPQLPDSRSLVQIVKSPELANISNRTVVSLFQKNRSQLLADSLGETREFLIFSNKEQFYTSFLNAQSFEKSSLKFFNLAEISLQRIQKILLTHPDSFGVFHLSQPQSAKILNSLSPELSKRILVVNVNHQKLIQEPSKFARVVDIYFKYPDIGLVTAKYIHKKLERVPASRKK